MATNPTPASSAGDAAFDRRLAGFGLALCGLMALPATRSLAYLLAPGSAERALHWQCTLPLLALSLLSLGVALTRIRSRAGWAELAAFAVIALAGLRLVQLHEQAFDIGPWDETGYMAAGLRLLDDGLPRAASAPLYAIWYFLLSSIESRPVPLYYLAYKLAIVLPPLALLAALRGLRVPRAPAVGTAFLFLVSIGNQSVWPKVSSFALSLLLFAIALAARARSPVVVMATGAGAALLASYARPEMALAAAVAGAAALLAFIVRRRAGRDRPVEQRTLAALAAVAVAATLLVGLPIGDRSGRRWTAFAQHFSLHWVRWQASPLNPWLEWDEVVRQAFGPARSIGEAVRAAPALFARHAGENLSEAGGWIDLRLLRHFRLRLPPALSPPGIRHRGVVAAMALWAAAAAWRGRTGWRQRLAGAGPTLALLGILSIPPLAAVVVIFAEDHYLILAAGLGLVAVATAIWRGAPAEPRASTLALGLVAGAALALVTPTPWDRPARRPNLDTVRALQALPLVRPTAILTLDGLLETYMEPGFTRVPADDVRRPLGDLLESREVGIVVLSKTLLGLSRLAGDPILDRLVSAPASLGFQAVPVPSAERTILVSEGLIGGHEGGAVEGARPPRP